MPRLIVYCTASSYDTVKTGKFAMPTSRQEMMMFTFAVATVEAKKYMNVIREESEIVKNTSSRLLDHLHTMRDAMPFPMIPPKLQATPAQATKSTSSIPNGSMNWPIRVVQPYPSVPRRREPVIKQRIQSGDLVKRIFSPSHSPTISFSYQFDSFGSCGGGAGGFSRKKMIIDTKAHTENPANTISIYWACFMQFTFCSLE